MRPRISAAAFRVKVIARIRSGSTPTLSKLTYRSTRTLVLPVPADASSTTFRRGSTAVSRAPAPTVISCRSSGIALPADRREAARLAPIHIVGSRGKLATSDRIKCRDQPLLGPGQHFDTLVWRREERHDPPRSLEGKIRRLAEDPAPTPVR